MARKVLEFDRGIIPQITYWSCGSASTEVALAVRGQYIAEKDLIPEVGTTVNGTDHISQITRVLNRRLNAGYVIQECPQDPPSQAMRDKLWRDVVGSINAGFAVVCNIVSPPSNRPRAVEGQSPNYGNSKVWHYFSVVGVDTEKRWVEIADSGFAPYHFWITLDNLASLIPPKGYAFVPGPMIESPAPAPAPSVPASKGLTAEVLSEAMGGTVSLDRYRQLLPAFTNAMIQAGCTTVERAAMFISQLGHESVGLKYMTELWGPTPDQQNYDRMMDNGPGEGYKFRGRGPIQVTGRRNYTVLSKWAHEKGYVPSTTFFLDNPDALASDQYGFLGAVWYWTTQRPLNDLADKRDIAAATRAINGGSNGLADRQLRYQRCLNLGAALLPSTTSGGDFTVAEADRVIDFIKTFVAPIGSDVKDIRFELVGDRDNPTYPQVQGDYSGHPSLYDLRAKKPADEVFHGTVTRYIQELDAKVEALVQIVAAMATKLDDKEIQA